MPLEPDRLYFFQDPRTEHLIGVRLDCELPDGGAMVTDVSTGRGRFLTKDEADTLEPKYATTGERQ